MKDVLLGTPWWVYVVAAYLLFVGYKISKPRKVTLKRGFLLPAVLILLSMAAAIGSGFILSTICHEYGMQSTILYKWLGVLCGSFLVGFAETRKMAFRKDSKHYQLVTSGGWLTPFIIVVIFATKYYLGYSLATTPTKELHLADLLTSQFIAGYALGRALSLGLKYYRRPVAN